MVVAVLEQFAHVHTLAAAPDSQTPPAGETPSPVRMGDDRNGHRAAQVLWTLTLLGGLALPQGVGKGDANRSPRLLPQLRR
jgi:hypothetical protein